MKRNILNFVVTIVLALILANILPWWSIMVAGFGAGLFVSLKRFAVFFVPFLAIFLLWAVHSYSLGSANDFILAKKIAVLMPLNGNPYLLILVTGIIGGIAAGIAGVFGKQCSILLKKKN